MKLKTSITLSADLVSEIDRLAGRNQSRSAFIEEAVRSAVRAMARKRQDARDLEILNRNAEELAREAHDVLDYQVPL
jgi:metal-responsive CopG/Arc/MetJ family transcriptional regulator